MYSYENYLINPLFDMWYVPINGLYFDEQSFKNKSKGISKMRKVTMYVPGDEVYVFDRERMDAVKKEITMAELCSEGAIVNKVYYIGEEPFAENKVFGDARECIKDALKTILTKSGYGRIMKIVDME